MGKEKYYVDWLGYVWKGPHSGTLRYAKFHGYTHMKDPQEIWVLERYDLSEKCEPMTQEEFERFAEAYKEAAIAEYQK